MYHNHLMGTASFLHDAASDATVATKPWYETAGADPELIGHMTNRGWDKLPADKAALEGIKAHREAERYVGLPADRIIRLPADAKDEAGWSTVWQRLGAGKEAKDYDFANVKDAAGKPIEQPLADVLRNVALKAHVPKDAAIQIAQEVVKHNDEQAKAEAADAAAKLQTERDALKTNWGVNFDKNKFTAQAGAAKLGITPEEVTALESVVGYAKVMEAFRRVGGMSGEDTFENPPNGRPGAMTKDQATARIAELKRDPVWAKRYMEGGVAENREMTDLIRVSVGDGVQT